MTNNVAKSAENVGASMMKLAISVQDDASKGDVKPTEIVSGFVRGLSDNGFDKFVTRGIPWMEILTLVIAILTAIKRFLDSIGDPP